jgi:glycosyltransferase involved in cell wall biosynthesis
MVLAHNEERCITTCLDSIFAAEPGAAFDVFVMANGCTDGTEDVVREYARRRPQVQLVSLELGDKCNAWNHFIHDVLPARCPGREIYFFMAGDARAVPGSFSAMSGELKSNPYPHAAAAVPASGRNALRDRATQIERHGLVANLYSLRGSFVERLRALAVRIPLRLEDDGGLVAALATWDLAPDRSGVDYRRIAPCARAAFEFEPLSPRRLADWLVYWKRVVRYGRRSYESQVLMRALRERGLAALPEDITDIYSEAGTLRLKWDGLYTVPNLVALLQMRTIGRARSQGKEVSPKTALGG